MRVAQVILGEPKTDPRTATVLRWQYARGMDPVVVHGHVEARGEPRGVLEEQRDDYRCRGDVGSPPVERYGLDLAATSYLGEALGELSLDAVHVHEFQTALALFSASETHFKDLRITEELAKTLPLRRPNVPWVIYDVHECERNREGRLEQSKAVGILEDRIIRLCDAVVSTSPTQAYILESFTTRLDTVRKWGPFNASVSWYPNGPWIGADTRSDAAYLEARRRYRKKLKLGSGDLVAVWCGSLSQDRFPLDTLDAFVNAGFAVVCFVPALPERASLRPDMAEHRAAFEAKGVYFVDGKQPCFDLDEWPDSLQDWLSIGDIGISVNTLSTVNNIVAFPNKIGEYAAGGVGNLWTVGQPDAGIFGTGVFRPTDDPRPSVEVFRDVASRLTPYRTGPDRNQYTYKFRSMVDAAMSKAYAILAYQEKEQAH